MRAARSRSMLVLAERLGAGPATALGAKVASVPAGVNGHKDRLGGGGLRPRMEAEFPLDRGAARDEHGWDGCNQLENRMTANALALMDKGDANRRILSKEQNRADFRRVEGATVKRKTLLRSAEGKRIYARCFYSFQANVYFISTLGRTKLPHESVEQVEQSIRERLEVATKELNQAIDGAELLFKRNGIEGAATYDTVPLEAEVAITSSLGRRYLELIHKLDQLMPLLQTLEIEEVINESQVEHQRSKSKRVVMAIASTARNLGAGIRRRMNEMDAKKSEADGKRGPGAIEQPSLAETELERDAGQGEEVFEVVGESDAIEDAGASQTTSPETEAAEVAETS